MGTINVEDCIVNGPLNFNLKIADSVKFYFIFTINEVNKIQFPNLYKVLSDKKPCEWEHVM